MLRDSMMRKSGLIILGLFLFVFFLPLYSAVQLGLACIRPPILSPQWFRFGGFVVLALSAATAIWPITRLWNPEPKSAVALKPAFQFTIQELLWIMTMVGMFCALFVTIERIVPPSTSRSNHNFFPGRILVAIGIAVIAAPSIVTCVFAAAIRGCPSSTRSWLLLLTSIIVGSLTGIWVSHCCNRYWSAASPHYPGMAGPLMYWAVGMAAAAATTGALCLVFYKK